MWRNKKNWETAVIAKIVFLILCIDSLKIRSKKWQNLSHTHTPPTPFKLLKLLKAYENFIQKVIAVVDNLALSKNKCINGTLQDWFDA